MRKHPTLLALTTVLAMLVAHPASADCPALPLTGNQVLVSTPGELESAVNTATAGDTIYIRVDDLDAVYEEFKSQDAFSHPVQIREQTPWGTREFGFFDPNRVAIFVYQDLD